MVAKLTFKINKRTNSLTNSSGTFEGSIDIKPVKWIGCFFCKRVTQQPYALTKILFTR